MKSANLAVLVAGALCLATSGLARADGSLAFDQGEGTPYQVLKRLYDEAGAPAQIGDFDSIDATTTNQACAEATVTDAEPVTYYVNRIEKVIPADGPLFPEKHVQKIIASYNYSGSPALLAMSVFDYLHVSRDANDLVLREDRNNMMYETPVTVRARRNGSFIAFHVIGTDSSGGSSAYGYCYRQ